LGKILYQRTGAFRAFAEFPKVHRTILPIVKSLRKLCDFLENKIRNFPFFYLKNNKKTLTNYFQKNRKIISKKKQLKNFEKLFPKKKTIKKLFPKNEKKIFFV